MRAFLASLVVGLTLLLLPASVHADTLFGAILDGLQEVPPNASPGIGDLSGTLTGGPGTWALTFSGNYSGLIAGLSDGHLHQAPPGVGGGVVYPIPGLSIGSTSGTYGGLWNPTDPQAAALLAGDIYVNLHTGAFPGGEIRGQLLIVPEPASLSLLGIASGVMLLRRRQRIR